MQTNRLECSDKIEISAFNEDGKLLAAKKLEGVHSIEAAIEKLVESEKALNAPEDYVYLVKDLTNNTENRYRLNAHGNVKLIV